MQLRNRVRKSIRYYFIVSRTLCRKDIFVNREPFWFEMMVYDTEKCRRDGDYV